MIAESLRIGIIAEVFTGKHTQSKNVTELKSIDEDFFALYKVPSTWDVVSLADCCYIHARIGWQALRKDEHQSDGEYLLVTGTDFSSGLVDYSTCVYISKDRYDMDEKIQLKNDDILVTKDGSIGKVAVVKDLPKPATLNAGVFVIRPDERFDKRYIEYLFQCSYFSHFVNLVKSGTTIKHLNQNKLMQFKIPVPTLKEQEEIVRILDKWLPEIDKLELLENKVAKLNTSFPDQMKKSILQQAVMGKLVPQDPNDEPASVLLKKIAEEKQKLIKEGKIKKQKALPAITENEIPFDIPESWEWVRWGTIAQSIQYGFNAPAQETGRIKMVRISDIQNNQVRWETVPYCEIDEKEISNYLLEENDILFARTGGTVGKSFLVKGIEQEAIYAGYLIRTRYSQRLCPDYLKLFMESDLYWRQLRNGTIATAQPNCNGQTLSKMLIPIPPAEEQNRIASEVQKYSLSVKELHAKAN